MVDMFFFRDAEEDKPEEVEAPAEFVAEAAPEWDGDVPAAAEGEEWGAAGEEWSKDAAPAAAGW
jgi:hypothetical protein